MAILIDLWRATWRMSNTNLKIYK